MVDSEKIKETERSLPRATYRRTPSWATCHVRERGCGAPADGMMPTADRSSSPFDPLVVLELVSDTKEEAVTWLLSRIRDPPQIGGAGLLVEQLGPGVGAEEKDNLNLFLVGASLERLLSGAEDLGLFKEYNDGSMRGFTCSNKHNFKDFK
ncbi:hypothetical protein AMECASPLE_014768, partial [Ameca splendens]